MAAAKWGTMPSVQPNAAATLAFRPRAMPAATVYNTPVPGVAVMTNEVSQNPKDMPGTIAGL